MGSRGSDHCSLPGSRICCPGHPPIPHPSADCHFITHQDIGGHPKSTGSVPHTLNGFLQACQGQLLSTGPTLWLSWVPSGPWPVHPFLPCHLMPAHADGDTQQVSPFSFLCVSPICPAPRSQAAIERRLCMAWLCFCWSCDLGKVSWPLRASVSTSDKWV